MLVQFSVENFLSFKSKATLSLEAESIRELRRESIHAKANHNLLKSIAIKGKNASGKSNFLKAMAFFKTIILTSQENSSGAIPVQPFILDKNSSIKNTLMEALFIIDGIKYQYGFELNRHEIVSEWLFAIEKREEVYFTRAGAEFRFSKKFKTEIRNRYEMISGMLNPTTLFLSQLSLFKDQMAQLIIYWVKSIIIINDTDIDDLMNFTAALMYKGNFNTEVCALFKESEINISSFEDEVNAKIGVHGEKYRTIINLWYEEEIKRRDIKTRHVTYNNEKPDGYILLDLRSQESSGTQKLFALAGPILLSLKEGRLILIDEIDSKFHFDLLNMLIRKFNSIANQNGAQLIFSSHNTTTLNPQKSRLRRDQFYFVEMTKYGESSIESMYSKDPTIRHDSAIQKNLEQGNLF